MVSSTTFTLAAIATTAVNALSFQSGASDAGHVQTLRARHRHQQLAARAPVSSNSRMVRKNKRATRTTYTSTANFYASTGGYSACHTYFGDDDMVIALPTGLWQDVTQVSPLCGQKVVATNPADGTSVTLTVQDASWSSTFATLPRGAYLALGGKEVDGVLPIEFYFKDSKALDASLLPTDTASATDVSWAPSTDKANHAEASVTDSGKVASQTSVKVEIETESATEAPVVVPTTTSVRQASVESHNAAVKIPTSTASPITPAFDSASAARASSSSVAAAQAQASADAKAEADKQYAEEQQAIADKKAAEEQAAQAQAEAEQKAAEQKAAEQKAAEQKAADEKAAQEKAAAEQKAAEEKAAADKAAEEAAAEAAKPSPEPKPAQGNVHSGGQATFFFQNGNPGHCGNYNQDSTKLIALPTSEYGDGSHCGKMVKITRVDTGKSVDAVVADSCPTCGNSFGDLDLSVAAFNALGSPSEGVFPITWQYI